MVANRECPACHRAGKLLLARREQRYHIFRIPISRWRTTHYRYSCELCGLVRVMSPPDAERLLAQFQSAAGTQAAGSPPAQREDSQQGDE